jgi:hypothetical protein
MIVIVLSLATKLGYIFAFGGGLSTFPMEGSDVAFYHTAARNLLATGSYAYDPGRPTTAMPPGQSAFLALLYAISNYSFAFAKLAHVMLLTCVAVLTYLTGKEIASAGVAFWGGVLIAIDPAQAYLSGTFLSEPLFIFLMVLSIYFLIRHRTKIHIGWLVGAGIGFGLAGLTRNQGWLFAIALWLGAIITRGRLMPLRAATIVLIVMFVTIAPWTLRNYQLTGHLIPVSSEGGLTLWASNNPEFVWRPPMPMSLPIYQIHSGLSEAEVDQHYRQHALEWIASHPLDFTINGIRKVIVLYSFDPLSWRPEVAGLYRFAGVFPYGLVMPFIFLGLIQNLRNPKFSVVMWYILFTTLMAALFYGDSRCRATPAPIRGFGYWRTAKQNRRLPFIAWSMRRTPGTSCGNAFSQLRRRRIINNCTTNRV